MVRRNKCPIAPTTSISAGGVTCAPEASSRCKRSDHEVPFVLEYAGEQRLTSTAHFRSRRKHPRNFVCAITNQSLKAAFKVTLRYNESGQHIETRQKLRRCNALRDQIVRACGLGTFAFFAFFAAGNHDDGNVRIRLTFEPRMRRDSPYPSSLGIVRPAITTRMLGSPAIPPRHPRCQALP